MKQERRKVLEMLANGCIDAQEAQLLLNTLYELQIKAEAKQKAFESVWDSLRDLGNLKMMAKEFGRIPQPTPPSNPSHYISWRPV